MAPSDKFKRKENRTQFDLGKMHARVDRVNVSGLLRTHNDYVLKAAESLFQAKNFQDVMLESVNTKDYLSELGIFKNIDIHIDVSRGEKASPNGYEVTFRGKELSRMVGSVGTEIGQNEGSLRMELNAPNLLGRGESISLLGAYSNTRASDISLKFWKSFFHTRFYKNRPEISFSLFRHLDTFQISKFKNSKLGLLSEFAVNTSFPFQLSHSLQYEASIAELSLTARQAPFEIREHCGPSLASLLRYSVMYDERDNPILPTYGFMLKSTFEYCGLGGNIKYMSNTTHAEISVPLIFGCVAQLSGRVGIMKDIKGQELPIANKFYCGGPLTLRGFAYGGAGPLADGTPIGAQTNWVGALHLWTPLPFSHVFKGLGNNFRVHMFYNVGNHNTFTLDKMRATLGCGLAYKFADRARIEMNYCLPIQKQPGDRVANGFQFGIGYEFV